MRIQTRNSVAMGVYNGERFLQAQLDSFVRQTRLPDELVVSDNSSTDATVEIIRAFTTRAPFVVRLFINDCNLGVTKNFERAISECTGDIIFLADCDDVWYPDKLEMMERVLRESDTAGVVVCDADLVDEQLHPLGRRLWEAYGFNVPKGSSKEVPEAKAFGHFVPMNGNCMAFRAGFKPLVLPLPDGDFFSRMGHDVFIAWTIVYSGVAGVALVPKPLLAYRQHPSQITGVAKQSFIKLVRSRLRSRGERLSPLLVPLLERLEERPQTGTCINPTVRGAMLRHWRTRQQLPAHRIARLPAVLRELFAQRYHRFSSGLLSAAKDILFIQ